MRMKKSLVLLLTLIYTFTFCGVVSLAEEERVDVAALAPAASSSTLEQMSAEYANDGINENETYTKWVSADDDNLPWWSVDLGLEYKISAIEIEAGIGTNEEERTNFRVIGSNNEDFSESIVLVDDVLADYGEIFTADVNKDERVRFVRVEKVQEGKLSIGEIRVLVNKKDILRGNQTEDSIIEETLAASNRYAIYSDIAGLACEESVYLLSQIGILNGYTDGTFQPQNKMTRAEFTAVIIRMLGKKAAVTESIFTDVPSSHWAYKEISTAAELGLVEGTGNSMFSPNDTVTASQVMKILVSAIGYSKLAEANGGYPYGYNDVASELKLYDKAGISGDTINRGQIAIVIKNALDAKTPEYYFDSENVHESFNGESMLNKYLKLKKDKAVVDGVNGSSLYDVNVFTSENYLSINGVEYYSEIPNLEDYLGLTVTYYYTDDASRAVPEVVAILVDSINEVKVIESEDLEDFIDGYLYYLEGDKSKKEEITTRTYVMYNGSALRGTYTRTEIVPDNGRVTLIDNNRDGTWDVYLIDDVKIGVVNIINTSSGSIYLRRSTDPISFHATDDIIEVYDSETGEKMTLSSIQPGDVVSIRASKNTQGIKKLKIVISEKSVLGSLTSKDSNENIIEIDGVEYKCASSFDYNSVSLGDQGEFYLSDEDFVAEFEGRSVKRGIYGYLKRAWIDEDTEDLMLRVFAQDGSWNTYTASDKIRIDGVKHTSATLARDNIRNIDSTFYQPIKFSVNNLGVMIELDTTSDVEDINDDTRLTPPVSIDASVESDDNLFWASTGIIGMRYGTTGDTIMMVLPENRDSEEDYKIITTASFKTYGYYTLDGYNMGTNNVFEFVIFKNPSQLTGTSNSVFIVESKTESLNSYDEPSYHITGYCNGQFAEYYLEPNQANQSKISDVEKGDVLTVSISARNEIESFDKKFYLEAELGQGVSLPSGAISDVTTSIGTFATDYYAYGKVKANEDNMMLVELYATPTPISLLVNVSGNLFNIYYYDADKEEVRLGSLSDIMDSESVSVGRESKVFLHLNNRQIKDIVVYN